MPVALHRCVFPRSLLLISSALLVLAACGFDPEGDSPMTPPAVYREWWAKTEACSGREGDMRAVAFFAVDAPDGAIRLGREVAHGWWVREGNRIYLPASALSDEWLVRHEMLHALLQRGSHPTREFVTACHVASAAVWRDSTLSVDPANPSGK
jgi:hypothetical protein